MLGFGHGYFGFQRKTADTEAKMISVGMTTAVTLAGRRDTTSALTRFGLL